MMKLKLIIVLSVFSIFASTSYSQQVKPKLPTCGLSGGTTFKAMLKNGSKSETNKIYLEVKKNSGLGTVWEIEGKLPEGDEIRAWGGFHNTSEEHCSVTVLIGDAEIDGHKGCDYTIIITGYKGNDQNNGGANHWNGLFGIIVPKDQEDSCDKNKSEAFIRHNGQVHYEQ